MRAELLAEARRLGFDRAGIARPDPPPGSERLLAWLAGGRHGEMAYLAESPADRLDPRLRSPWIRSILVVAKNYRTEDRPGPAPGRGSVARYAWGDDYHDWMKDRLRKLEAWVEARGVRAAPCVDTSALMEKPLANRAGLGWIGKHANLDSTELGSWFLLGELLLGAELEADPPFADRCGSCTACIPACPTGAITAPYQLDARRCISYLTIELQGPIPVELRPLVGSWVFGCDLCLDACPWNSHAVRTTEPAFRPRNDLTTLDLAGLLDLDEAGFAARFANSPIRRAELAGLQRNACVALGNQGDPAAIPILRKALGSPHDLVREHAAWALERLASADV